jgi:hypothetical protein
MESMYSMISQEEKKERFAAFKKGWEEFGKRLFEANGKDVTY